jgi:hypothetical protein
MAVVIAFVVKENAEEYQLVSNLEKSDNIAQYQIVML